MNMVRQVEEKLIASLQEALKQVAAERELELAADKLAAVEVEVPREKEHGDYASNIALVMAGDFQTSPRELAEELITGIDCDLIADISVAGPGFINFTLKKDWLYEVLALILEMGTDYGRVNAGKGEKVLLEFVSANPTGPLHVGHSRGAVTGDVLASIMEKAGFDVQKEYYINDAGNQIDILGRSTLIRYQQQLGQQVELPEDCYAGDYLREIAADLKQKYGRELLEYPEDRALEICSDYTYQKMMDIIKEDLQELGVEFDSWFSERQLHQGKIEQVIELLREQGYIYEQEGAIWFKASDFFDEKDRVVIKSEGIPTYLAADIAYHYDKLERGFDSLINIWGADHHGYIPRMKSVIKALGYEADRLQVLIVQIVSLLKQGQKVSMSKRAGDFVTLKDVIEEVGRDAARYFYIMRSSDSHLDFDLDLAREESNKNPVYYIQYAHARIHSILEHPELNREIIEELEKEQVKFDLLSTPEEIELMKLLARYPEEIRVSAHSRQPHHITSYVHELAGAFHVFYNKCRVITEDEEISTARFYLVEAVRQVLSNVLELLGLEAPRQM